MRWLMPSYGFPPKPANLGWPDKSHSINAVLTKVAYMVSLSLGTLDHPSPAEQLQQGEK